MGIVNFKIILKRPDNTQEARIIAMHDSSTKTLVYFQEKLLALFPDLNGKQYNIFWKDFEDDEIVIKSDDELVTFLLSNPNNMKKIYVDLKNNVQEREEVTPRDGDGEIHHGVKCDECEETVKGIRLKCLQCPDYDLCEKCELKHLHPDHIMMKIPFELPHHLYSHWSRIMNMVDYMVKSAESSQHSRKDHSEKCGRRCRGKSKRSCNCDGKDGDRGTGETKDKHEGTAYDNWVKAITVPVELILVPEMLRRDSRSESHCDRYIPREFENAVSKTLKFFVGAIKEGFTPETRSEMGQGEGSEEKVKSKPQNENEKVTEDKKENEILDVIKRKLRDQRVSENNGEASDTTSTSSASSKMDNVEKQQGNANTEKPDPDVSMDRKEKIEEALQGMLAMGFSNEGGTLQKMLEEMDGDITRVLESIDSSLM